MVENGKLTTNGWLFVAFLVLTLTTTVNPFINIRHFTLPWFVLLSIYGIWVLARLSKEEGGE